MAQSPGFDLNDPVNAALVTDAALAEAMGTMLGDGKSNEFYDKFNEIWRCFNIKSTFEPGSIFKPITVAAALEEGVITTSQHFYCGGFKIYAGIPIQCHVWNNGLGRIHGAQTLEEAIMNSCNCALMEIAELMGRSIFYKYQHDFGYGEQTGIDLSGEEDCASLLHSLVGLNESELATSSFGQRFNCTPIQAITSFAALINGGTLYQPYLVAQRADSRGNVVYNREPVVTRKVISRETSDYLRKAMQLVISDNGTGRNAQIPGYAIGGKTGTGEQGVKGRPGYSYTLSFIGYLPADDPQFLVLAMIDRVPEEVYDNGLSSAAPMIKEVFQYLIDSRGIQPVNADADAIPRDKTEVGNYIGKPLIVAVHEVNTAGLDYAFDGGSGTVVMTQSPEPGTVVPIGTTVRFTISDGGGYTLRQVPDVMGLETSVAETVIIEAGFVPVVAHDTSAGPAASDEPDEIFIPEEPKYVYRQMPAAGVNVAEGLEVKIRVK